MDTTCSFDRVLIAPPKRTQQNRNNNTKKDKIYRSQYSDDDVVRLLLEWYQSDLSTNKFLMSKQFHIPRATFQRHIKGCQLDDLKKNCESLESARFCVEMYVDSLQQNTKVRTASACEGNQYLTEDEEAYLYQMIRISSLMGHGLSRKETLHLIDGIIYFDHPEISRLECSKHVLNRFLAKHEDLKNVAGASLCPQRASKATVDTRDAMFAKLDAFVEHLHDNGYVPWKSVHEIPKDCIYNMDEVGADTTKHRGNVLASSLESMRTYTITPEGDGKMNMHITCCLTSRADGKLLFCCCFSIWLIVVSYFWLIVVLLVSRRLPHLSFRRYCG